MKKVSIKKKVVESKILGGETQKLQDKLNLLKKQIQAKKKEKQQNSNKKTLESSPSQAPLSRSESRQSKRQSQPSQQLAILLTNLKIEAIADKLKSKNITTIEQFNKINEEQLDSWKDIAVGYRIKIKKFLNRSQMMGSSSKKALLNMSPNARYASEKKDIEAIVKNRKQQQVYVPIKRDRDQNDEPEQFIGEEQQEIMFQSLMKAFKQSPQKRQVQEFGEEEYYSDEELQNLEGLGYTDRIYSVKYINSENKQDRLLWAEKPSPDYKYCWRCLIKLEEQKQFKKEGRIFCSETCIQSFQASAAEEADKSDFTKEFQLVQEQFNHLLEARKKEEEKARAPKKPVIRRQARPEPQSDQEPQQEMQEIDLSIV